MRKTIRSGKDRPALESICASLLKVRGIALNGSSGGKRSAGMAVTLAVLSYCDRKLLEVYCGRWMLQRVGLRETRRVNY